MSDADVWSLPAIERGDSPEELAAKRVAKLEAALAEARERGYREGLANGEQEIRDKAAHFDRLCTILAEPLADLDDEVEEALVDLACRIARQVVRRELQLDRSRILVVAREALAALPLNARKIRVVLHPKDAELVRESLVATDQGAKWRIEEDPLIARGGAKVLSERSLVDATVEKRLQDVIEALIDDERSTERTGSP